jgi:hypothetical protein
MIIGRKKEIETLQNICNEQESKLLAIYGRRRIGKTYLIEQLFKEMGSKCLFFSYTGDYDGVNKTQLFNFKEAIYDWFKKDFDEFDDWSKAFATLKRVINSEIKELNHKGKVVLFLDEVPWIDSSDNNGF